MKAVVTAVSSWSLGGADVDLAALPLLPGRSEGGSGFAPAPDAPRPEAVPAGAWRRMSRVARIAAACAAPLVERRSDRDDLPLFFGTGVGEFSSTAAFLRTLFTKGPAGASPLLFQNAVHNAAAGHVSIAFGLRGPSETLCAGPLTSFRLLERALAWVARNERPALVLAADDLGPDVQQGWAYADAPSVMGEGGAALLLAPAGAEGVPIAWHDAAPEPGDWLRAGAYPAEVHTDVDSDARVATDHAHDHRLGLYPACDLVALAACVRAGRGAVALGAGVPGAPHGPVRVVVGA